MSEYLTLDEVIDETNKYFDEGNGNSVLCKSMIAYMQQKKDVPHAVLVSLGLEKRTVWRKLNFPKDSKP